MQQRLIEPRVASKTHTSPGGERMMRQRLMCLWVHLSVKHRGERASQRLMALRGLRHEATQREDAATPYRTVGCIQSTQYLRGGDATTPHGSLGSSKASLELGWYTGRGAVGASRGQLGPFAAPGLSGAALSNNISMHTLQLGRLVASWGRSRTFPIILM